MLPANLVQYHVSSDLPRCNRRLSGCSAHGNVVLINIIVFGANTSQWYHAFIKLRGIKFKENQELYILQKGNFLTTLSEVISTSKKATGNLSLNSILDFTSNLQSNC